MAERFASYDVFWLDYLKDHSKPATRAMHYFGTGLAIMFLVKAVIELDPWFVLVAIVSGYLYAWLGHWLIQKNQPKTFSYPLWSLASDFRMFFLFLTQRLDRELQRAGVSVGAL